MKPDERAAAAAELAERILEEVSRAAQDWRKISAWAYSLAALADGAVATARRGGGA